MITLSDEARQELEDYFSTKKKSPIRVFVAKGCSGSRLALALDPATDKDKTFADNGFTFVVSEALLNTVGAISISLTDMGFEVNSETPLPNTGGGCRGCPSAAGCGQ
jgi:Fe-S cluster assembly iron-binding protein IscA